ncbi:Glycosyltransferase Gtf1 [uncultured archaeon]|nr:Glycosyltransferase Gtf1 [uncultured archaeon]
MKIAIFTDSFPPLLDGVVTATLNLAKGLADKGHKVYIIAPKVKGLKKEFSYRNIKVKRLMSMPAMFYEGYRITSILNLSLLKFLKSEKIELIHFQTPITVGIQGILISKILKVPLVGTFHTFFTDKQYLKNARMDYKIVEKAGWRYARLLYDSCNLITAPSESTKRELLHHKFTSPIEVISNGIDSRMFSNKEKEKVREKYLEQDKNLLLFVGRIAHGKNIPYLLDCFKLILKKSPKTKLLIIGNGPQFEELEKRVIKLKLEKKVILAGRIEHEKFVKSSILGACDLFVTASTTENQPMTMLEAQINALPCVGIAKRGVKDLIKNDYNGYLIKNNDKENFAKKVVCLLKNNSLKEKFRENTLEEVKKHELKSVISRWEKVYSKLIKEKSKNSSFYS